jgi:hypothetical protein
MTGAGFRDDPRIMSRVSTVPSRRSADAANDVPTRHNLSGARVDDIGRNERPDSGPRRGP